MQWAFLPCCLEEAGGSWGVSIAIGNYRTSTKEEQKANSSGRLATALGILPGSAQQAQTQRDRMGLQLCLDSAGPFPGRQDQACAPDNL